MKEILRMKIILASESPRRRKILSEMGYLFENGWNDWLRYREDYPSCIEDIRFICWFDN